MLINVGQGSFPVDSLCTTVVSCHMPLIPEVQYTFNKIV